MHSKTLLALALSEKDTDAARAVLDKMAAKADVVEIRLDLMDEFNLATLLRDRPCPVIVTYRPVREGGRYDGDEDRRLAVLQEAAALGAEHIDCEADAFHKIADQSFGQTKVIVSRHDFSRMYPSMREVYSELCAVGGTIAKLVCTAANLLDPLEALAVMRDSKTPVIAITMGTAGVLSRLLAPKYGAYLTFCSPNGDGTAPGQLPIDSMHQTYRIAEMNAGTKPFGLLTRATPDIALLTALNKAIRTAGHNAVTVPLQLQAESPAAVMRACADFGFDGFLVGEDLAQAPDLLAVSPATHGAGGRVDVVRNINGALTPVSLTGRKPADCCAALLGR